MHRFHAPGLLAWAILSLLSSPSFAECGVASVYWEGSRTASGERFKPDGISAAHKTLPFGAMVVVRNQKTGAAIRVRINDRGPFVRGRIIDLSRGAARAFGMGAGLASVCIEVVAFGEGRKADRVLKRKGGKARRVRRIEEPSFLSWW
jgi:rare lipoprotein A